MTNITQTKRFKKNFSSLLESILEKSPPFALSLLDSFDKITASINRFPEIGVPRIRNWYGKNVILRDIEIFVRQRQFTVRYHYKKSLHQIVLVHIWIDGQNHN
jgi:hypothetical protein